MAKIIKVTEFASKTTTGNSGGIGPTSHHRVAAYVTTTGASGSPSVTVKIQGSLDNVTFEDITGASETITTDTTTFISPTADVWYPYYRLAISSITTITVSEAVLLASGFAGVDGLL